jgi:A/G-specific adenine glycosylase
MNFKTLNSREQFFQKQLLQWNKEKNNRSMPWKGEKDPYKIWLSEIILQQTRVEQGWDYYNRFIKTFPTVEQLAKAPENKVFKLWEGLGYYSRCKNLIASAKKIAGDYQSKFPDTYEAILELKGVGPYTAAAIASFAFNLPYAVVDGNVFRVLARYFGNDTATDSTAGKKLFTTMAAALIEKKQPGIYNQAIMDFGATVCKPQLPECSTCPLSSKCVALAKNRVDALPVKEKKITIKNRWLYYAVVTHNNEVLVRKRTGKDIWENLYEFVLHESNKALAPKEIQQIALLKKMGSDIKVVGNSISAVSSQKLSHQTIHAQFIKITLNKKLTPEGYEWVAVTRLKRLAFPKIITSYLKDKNVSLNLTEAKLPATI